jgi:tetratricopeptide (TPR) repeat protein
MAISTQKWRILALSVIVLAGIFAYSNTLRVPFVMDDHSLNYFGQRNLLDILLHGGSRRVADFTFALNYRLHGLQVTGFHLTNMAIHLSAALSLYFLAVSALEALRQTFPPAIPATTETVLVERFVPLAVALLFTLHPIQTQAVTYIIQRYTSLASLFYLLAALCFVNARLAFEEGSQYRKIIIQFGGTLAAGLLAIGSKQIAVTMPLMLIILEIFLFRGRLLNRRFSIVCGTLFILLLMAGSLYWRGNSLQDILYDLHHATAEDPHMPRTTYFLTQTRVVATYLRLLCLPLGQSFVHESPVYPSLSATPVLLSLALHTSLIVSALTLFRESGKNLQAADWLKGALQRLTALGTIWFYCAMSVESSIFPIRDIIFEHRIYLPSAGFFLAIAAGTALLARYCSVSSTGVWSLLVVTCCLLGGLTFARNQVWRSELTLWQDAVTKAPNSALALANLGAAYLNQNMPKKTLPLLVTALEIKPNLDANSKIYLGKTLQGLNIGKERFTTGEELVQPGGGMVIGGAGNRGMAAWEGIVYNNMALAYEYMGQLDKALEFVNIAVWVTPAYDKAWYNLGLLSLRVGDRTQFDRAENQLKALNSGLAEELATASRK